jgi:hypothetical protein
MSQGKTTRSQRNSGARRWENDYRLGNRRAYDQRVQNEPSSPLFEDPKKKSRLQELIQAIEDAVKGH